MPEIAAVGPGSWLIELRRRETPLPFVRACFASRGGAEKSLFIPALPHTSYLLRTHAEGLRIRFDAAEVESVALRRVGLLTRKFLTRRRSDRRHGMTIADGTTLTPLLRREGRQGREFIRALRLIGNWGFGLMSDNLQRTPGLLAPRAEAAPAHAVNGPQGAPRFAVALHLFYRDLWPEFESALRALDQSFHLIVTTTEKDADFEARVRAAFPSAEIHVYENRGRDLGPFVQLLRDGRLDAWPLICKLHGKRSGAEGPRALFGEVWRRTNVADLIGSTQQVEKILRRFETAPQLGMIGSPRFRLPNEFIQHRSAWGENRDATLDLAARMGLAPKDFRLDFFAGTMFWIRREALAPLRQLDLCLADFPDENGALDGEFQHALERALGAAPQAAGMFLDSAPVAGE
ncbi:MAG TPA: rhamnan synthesis F family protein [Bellilinea sp.]|nr:rhamnan synthesis F family protein [Bellilinea sp.]